MLFLGRITAVGRCRCYFWDESPLWGGAGAIFEANHHCGEVQVLYLDESPLWGGAGAIFGANHRCGEVQVLFLGRITVV